MAREKRRIKRLQTSTSLPPRFVYGEENLIAFGQKRVCDLPLMVHTHNHPEPWESTGCPFTDFIPCSCRSSYRELDTLLSKNYEEQSVYDAVHVARLGHMVTERLVQCAAPSAPSTSVPS